METPQPKLAAAPAGQEDESPCPSSGGASALASPASPLSSPLSAGQHDASSSATPSEAGVDGSGLTFEELCSAGDTPREWGTLPIRAYRAVMRPLLRPVLRVAMRRSMPTSHAMLVMRSANAAFGRPNANADWCAPLFFKALMPNDAASIATPGRPTLYARFRRLLLDAPGVGLPGMINFLDARTQFFDDAVARALDAGAITQVVVLAAGFDSTAYRLGRPGVKFFEVDLPALSARKRALVAAALPPDAPRPAAFVGADLAATPLAEALAGSGFDPAQPTLWTCQGLLYYLPPAAVRALLAGVRGLSAPRSRLAFDFLRRAALEGTAPSVGLESMAVAVAARGEPFLSALDDAPGAVEALAALLGFRCAARLGARALCARFLPHLAWRDFPPTVEPCFAFAEFEV